VISWDNYMVCFGRILSMGILSVVVLGKEIYIHLAL